MKFYIRKLKQLTRTEKIKQKQHMHAIWRHSYRQQQQNQPKELKELAVGTGDGRLR